MSRYKWCFVPQCANTSICTPEKVFFSVPKDKMLRKKWFSASRRVMNVSEKSDLYCCEDHFKLDEDMENYLVHAIMGGRKYLKKSVVPHIFHCQTAEKRKLNVCQRSAAKKRAHKALVEDAMNSLADIPGTSNGCPEEDPLQNPTPSTSIIKNSVDFGVQTHIYVRSIGVMTNIENKTQDKEVMAVSSVRDAQTMTLSIKEKNLSNTDEESDDTDNNDIHNNNNDEDSDFVLLSDEEKEEIVELYSLVSKSTVLLIKRKPKMYLGIAGCWFPHIMSILTSQSNLSERNIFITLLKIKSNDTFERIGDQFEMSCSNVSRIFCQSVPVLAHFLKELIIWPKKYDIVKQLPIPFRLQYSNVQSIIDCLEIEIEKPSDPVKQALTWSEYKKCNTLKYLVSSTPDGTINFVSKGYGGRMGDVTLLEKSGYLDVVPSGCGVMADRGFKNIEQKLLIKQCKLIKPPSVPSGQILSKEDVILTKRVASLRIHIERLIRRIREFKFLKSHSVVNSHLICHTDDIVKIACGLINIQSPIIKT